MNSINLSYVITTRNKLSYLKEAMACLLAHIKCDEEIIIADAASTDGTVEYLKSLHEQGRIHQFVSEPDAGEGHGYNKCFFLARGELIKIISDDDVFFYPGIQQCKLFMLANPHIDVLGTQGAIRGETLLPIEITAYLDSFEAWQKYGKPFEFGNPGLMLRRKSLPLIGMYDTNYLRIDTEFTCRISAGKANVAWFTNICWIHVSNPESNSKNLTRMEQDTDKLRKIYKIDSNRIEITSRKLRGITVSFMYQTVRLIIKRIPYLNKFKAPRIIYGPEKYFPVLNEWLEEANSIRKAEFLYKI